jgi:hypothetical protein
MSRNIHSGSFITPTSNINYLDGRHLADAAIRKAHRLGPISTVTLTKRDTADTPLTLSRQERLRRSNAAEALEEVGKVHRAGGRRSLDEPQGDPQFQSRSVEAVRKARQHALPISEKRLPSAREVSKAFADQVGRIEIDIDSITQDFGYATQVRAMTKAEKRAYRRDASNMHLSEAEFRKTLGKAFGAPSVHDVGTHPPQSNNSTWNDAQSDTGATNSFRDQPVPSNRPTLVGSQNTTTPNTTDRDAAIADIKKDLSKPKRLGARDDDDRDQDRTAELNEDDADDDESRSRVKDPNADDAVGNSRSRKGKPREDTRHWTTEAGAHNA